MRVTVSFYSYFKDLAGAAQLTEELPEAATLNDLLDKLARQIPKLETMKKSVLLAVGVEYQTRDYWLKDGDEVSLFPPVQGG